MARAKQVDCSKCRYNLDYIYCSQCTHGYKSYGTGPDYYSEESIQNCLNCEYDADTVHSECTNCTHNSGFHDNWAKKDSKFQDLCNKIRNKYKK